jgi:AcrR family transcriptional regulator
MKTPESARNRPRRLPYAQRHAQLLDLAEALFIERGYAAVTMEDIARAAGVTRPIVYSHLESREGAYLACLERVRVDYQAELERYAATATTAREFLRSAAEGFFAILESTPGRWQLMFGGAAVLPGEATKALAAQRFATIEQIRRLLEPMAPDTSADALSALSHSMSGVAERLGHWWLERPDLEHAHLVDYFVDIMWAGLRQHVADDA